jgi:hypothetical protein
MRVLISHDSRREWKFAQDLAEALREVGVEPRIENLKAVCGWDAEKLQRELRARYNYVIAVLSSSYMHDRFLATELLEALIVEQFAKTNYVIPLVVGDCYIHPPLCSRVIDFRSHRSYDQAFAQVNASLIDARESFVIMMFGDPHLDSAYKLAIRPVLEQFDFSVVRIDEVQNSGSITDQVLEQIERSAVVLADLSGERPNCYLEVGYALALQKELILTCRKDDHVHFDLEHKRIIFWETESELHDALLPRLEAVKERARRISGPSIPPSLPRPPRRRARSRSATGN